MKAPSDLVGRLRNILASSGEVLREIIPTILVILFLIIIGYEFDLQKFLIKEIMGRGPENEVAVPSRKEDTRVPSLARIFFSRRH